MISKMLRLLICCNAKDAREGKWQISPTTGKFFPTPERLGERIKKSCNFKRRPTYMGWRLAIALHFFFILHCSLLSAQQVSYCEPFSDRFTLRQEMVGRIGDYYWVSAINKRRVTHKGAITEERDFVVYDQRMNVSNLIQDPPYSASSIKEYLVTTDEYFDRVQLLNADNKSIEVRLQRYTP